MNRIVIIGNGFDLAHTLPTSYEDFIVDLIKTAYAAASDTLGKIYRSPLVTVNVSKKPEVINNTTFYEEFKTIKEFRDSKLIASSISKSHPSNFAFISFAPFLGQLLQDDYSWTDIEKTYFDKLLTIAKSENYKAESKKLNDEFALIKEALKEYISKVQNKPKHKINAAQVTEYQKIVNDFTHRPFEKYDAVPNKVMIINFNYTQTFKPYINKTSRLAPEIVNIHGTTSPDDDIIFGYGDLSHKEYDKIRDHEEPEMLLNMKLFQYALKTERTKLDKFIKSGDGYDVHVIGHSLGVSDRVLLNEIFDTNQCFEIRLFHRGKTSFHKKHIVLGFHFMDNSEATHKIIPFNPEDTLPELS